MTSTTCVYTLSMLADGTEPAPGSCLGPQDRAAARRAAMSTTGCGTSKVTFAVDASSTVTSCGDCVPGQTFLEDGACSIGQYCTDDGLCRNVTTSPFWRLACAYDLGAHTSLGQCGPGLRCYSNRCVECIPGVDAIPGTLSCTESGLYTLRNDSGVNAQVPCGTETASTWADWDLASTPRSFADTLIVVLGCLQILLWVHRGFVACCVNCRDEDDREDSPLRRTSSEYQHRMEAAAAATNAPTQFSTPPAMPPRDPFSAAPSVAPLRPVSPPPSLYTARLPLRRSTSEVCPVYRSPPTDAHVAEETLPTSWRAEAPAAATSPRRARRGDSPTAVDDSSARSTPTIPRRHYRAAPGRQF